MAANWPYWTPTRCKSGTCRSRSLVREIWRSDSLGRIEPEIVEWVDNTRVLMNGADLIAIPQRIVLWHYDVPGQVKSVGHVFDGNLAFGYAQESGRGRGGIRAGAFFMPLPHPEAVDVAAGLDEEKLLVLKPGTQVALDLGAAAIERGGKGCPHEILHAAVAGAGDFGRAQFALDVPSRHRRRRRRRK